MSELEVFEQPALHSAPSALVAWADAASAAHRLAVPLCRTQFVPAHFKDNEDAATAAILFGAEAGLSPLQALQGIYVIGGKPAMYARTMLAVTLAAGHEVMTEESTDVRAVVKARRKGSSHVETVVVTIDQAKRAGWTSNKKYQTEPAAMLLARAQSQACRRVAPDALLGMAYSAEELIEDRGADLPQVRRTARRRTEPAAPVEAVEPALDAPTSAVDAAAPHAADVVDAEPSFDDAPVDAEVVEEPDTGEAITDPQLKKVNAMLREAGHDRASALAWASEVLGRPVDSTKSLTTREASLLIDRLEADARQADSPR